MNEWSHVHCPIHFDGVNRNNIFVFSLLRYVSLYPRPNPNTDICYVCVQDIYIHLISSTYEWFDDVTSQYVLCCCLALFGNTVDI